MDTLSKSKAVEFNESYSAVEIRPGQFVAAKRIKRTATGTVVFEALDRSGKVHRGTKAQIVKAVKPYTRKGDATTRANKGAES